ncbi:hypothetical protein LIER_35427 [Lithospermum erythrorhizon]|uniref:Uncharacterized protein n=1 Tax=Lithospermum erythrorhizon TaxID=34254 RepID=A0AAV3NQM4_LITER
MVVGFCLPATSALDAELLTVNIFWSGVTTEVSRSELIHVLREQNQAADWVAKAALAKQRSFSWHPDEVDGKLPTLCNLESRGVPYVHG